MSTYQDVTEMKDQNINEVIEVIYKVEHKLTTLSAI